MIYCYIPVYKGHWNPPPPSSRTGTNPYLRILSDLQAKLRRLLRVFKISMRNLETLTSAYSVLKAGHDLRVAQYHAMDKMVRLPQMDCTAIAPPPLTVLRFPKTPVTVFSDWKVCYMQTQPLALCEMFGKWLLLMAATSRIG